MNANTNSKAVSGIVEKAMLVDLTVSRYSVSRKDRTVTDKVKDDYHASGDVGQYNKRLFPQMPQEARDLQSVISTIQTEHRRMTLPWAQGWRILPRDMHAEYSTAMQSLRHEFTAKVKAMAEALPTLIPQAQIALGAMFKEHDYPSPATFTAMHSVSIKFMPVPDVGDFRINLDAETMRDIRAGYEADMQECLKAATRDAWERLHSVVTNLVAACDRVDEKTAAESDRIVIRKAIVDNVIALTGTLSKLNLADDPHLEELRAEALHKLGRLKVSDLRDDMQARSAAKADANAILKKMSAFMPPRSPVQS